VPSGALTLSAAGRGCQGRQPHGPHVSEPGPASRESHKIPFTQKPTTLQQAASDEQVY
jgi:hypothetical protein